MTEAEDIKKGWQEYTEELYKKDLHNPDNHDGVITHLEPDPSFFLEHYLSMQLPAIRRESPSLLSNSPNIRFLLFGAHSNPCAAAVGHIL